MKIFVTDKYHLLTFALICGLICFSFAITINQTKTVSSTAERKIPIYCVDRIDDKISITFDCAWGDGDIDKIISVLKKHSCKATFFVLGTWAEAHPDSLKKLYDAGHEIGNHSYNHACYTNLSMDEILSDMKKCDEAITKIIGKSPKLFRAPSGDYNNTVIDACESSGRTYIQWSVDSLDWKDLDTQQMLDRIVPKTKSGDILLFHNDTKHTAESLDKILTELENKGFSFSNVSDLIYKDNYTIDHTGKQIRNGHL